MDFEELLGRPIPPNYVPQKGSFTINTPIGDMGNSFIGRVLHNRVESEVADLIEGQEGTVTALLIEAVVEEMPLRGILMRGETSISRELLDALLDMINGKYLKGAAAFVKAIRRK